jgi:hypothetical protein
MSACDKPNARPMAVSAWILAVASLAAFNWHLAVTPVETSPVQPGSDPSIHQQQRSAGLATPLDKKPAAAFQEMASRPLFDRDRRPIEARKTDSAESQAIATDLHLVGVMSQGTESKRALIRLANETLGKWVDEGSEINGWTLKTVNEHSIVIETGGRTQELVLVAPGRNREEQDTAEPRRPVR